MQIEITTDRKPWADGVPQDRGAIIDVHDSDAKTLIDAGFAVAVKKPKVKANE
jgi:hypothetical protein